MRHHFSADTASLADLLMERAQARPEKLAYRFSSDGRQMSDVTLGELHARSGAIAAGLREMLPARSVVWLVFHNDFGFISSLFGCLYADLIPVPIPTSRFLSKDDAGLQMTLADSEAAAVLTSPSMLGKATSRLQACGSRLVDHVLTDARCAQANTTFVARPAPASVAYLQYTSGSISAPRGVMITHRNVITNLASIQDSFAHDEQSVSVSW